MVCYVCKEEGECSVTVYYSLVSSVCPYLLPLLPLPPPPPPPSPSPLPLPLPLLPPLALMETID